MKNKFSMHSVCLQTLFLVMLFLFTNTGFAQSSKVNWDRMNRDLEIMQGVLNNLLAPSMPVLAFSNGGARGLYFEGYGVVFQVDHGGSHLMDGMRFRAQNDFKHAREMAVEATKRSGRAKTVPAPPPLPDEGPVIIDGASGAIMMKEALTLEKQIELLEERAIEFLRDYADAIGQIKPNDRITILANLEHNSVFRIHLRSAKSAKERPSGLNITVKKSDIVNFRKGKIDEKTFRDRITFHKRVDSKQKNRNIDIMANILNTALTRNAHNEFNSDHRKKGMYLEGLGALFFIRTRLFQERDRVTYEHYLAKYLEEQEQLRAMGAKGEGKGRQKNPEDDLRDSIDTFKNELIELVGDYGHTLRTIKPAEHVVINVDFKNNWEFHFVKTPGHLVLKVQKQDLDRYSSGNLSLAALRKKVDIQEF